MKKPILNKKEDIDERLEDIVYGTYSIFFPDEFESCECCNCEEFEDWLYDLILDQPELLLSL